MPVYFKKSVTAGPFRFNFSKGGIGASVGVKGFRIGAGPKGHYVHTGRSGIYYRSSLGAGVQSRKVYADSKSSSGRLPIAVSADGVEMYEIESGSIQNMQDEKFSDVLGDLNEKQAMVRLFVVLGGVFGAFALVGFAVGMAVGVGLSALALLVAWVGSWFDSYRRAAVLFYELDEEKMEDYTTLARAFDELKSSGGKWHIEASGKVTDLTTWKRNGGANQIVSRKPTALDYQLPKVLNCNVSPPSINVGRQTMYFMPDVILFEEGNVFGAFQYKDVEIQIQKTRFIEEEKVPHDATIVGQTWRHPNKKGGPDRRFSNNYEIPICLYETIHFESRTGLNELLEFSRHGGGQRFSDAAARMSSVQ